MLLLLLNHHGLTPQNLRIEDLKIDMITNDKDLNNYVIIIS
jgi:hypothetical protein